MTKKFLEALLSPDFEDFRRQLASSDLSDVEKAKCTRDCLDSLDEDTSLSNGEKERRVAELLDQFALSRESLRAVATHVQNIKNPILRNTVAQCLPPELRSSTIGRNESRTEASSHGAIPAPVASVTSEEKPAPRGDLENLGSSPLLDEVADVLILSLDEDPASRKLLESAGLTALRYSEIGDVDKALNSNDGVCAVVIESSFWSTISIEQQATLLRTLGSYSTFIWLKIAEPGLLLSREEVFRIIADARCSPSNPGADQVFVTERGGIQERDLPSISRSRTRLSGARPQGLFVPGEINDAELRLLVAALTDFVQRKRFRLKAAVSLIRTRFVQTGRTDDAKVAVVRVNELRIPIIVKLASGTAKNIIVDEANRFHTFIQAGDKELNPEIHLHGTCGLIIFGLIESGDDDQQPAPTLDEVLKELWYSEMFGEDTRERQAKIAKGVAHAVRKISELNKIRCSETGFTPKANPYLVALKGMEAKGFSWGFGPEVLEQRSIAEKRVDSAALRAVAQGDLHSRNILIRGENGYVIDYAYSGPGHPCADLVRLELSLFFNYFTPFVAEQEIIRLQKELSISRASAEQIMDEFPEAFRSGTNRLCIRLCVLARDGLSGVLQAHSLDWEQYKATKLLSAWQSLQVPSLQRSLVRTVIAALS